MSLIQPNSFQSWIAKYWIYIGLMHGKILICFNFWVSYYLTYYFTVKRSKIIILLHLSIIPFRSISPLWQCFPFYQNSFWVLPCLVVVVIVVVNDSIIVVCVSLYMTWKTQCVTKTAQSKVSFSQLQIWAMQSSLFATF